MNTARTLALTALIAIPTLLAAQSTRYLYVALSDSNSVAVVDPSTDTAVNTIHIAAAGATGVGTRPYAIAITPDTTAAYVVNESCGYANPPLTSHTAPAPIQGTVSVIDITVPTNPTPAIATIPVGNCPSSIAISPDGTQAYVSNSRDGTVSVISTAAKTVTATVVVVPSGTVLPTYSTSVAINSAGTAAYVGDTGGNLHVIATATNTVVQSTSLKFGNTGSICEADQIAFTPDGALIFVSSSGCGTFDVLNAATTELFNAPLATYCSEGGMAASPLGGQVFLLDSECQDFVSISTAAPSYSATNTFLPAFANFIAVSGDGAKAYISASSPTGPGAGGLFVLNTASPATPAGYTLRFADDPAGLALTPLAPTTTSLTAAPSPSVYNQPVTLTATVTSIAAGTPTGTVTFTAGSVTLGSAALTAGSASIPINGLNVGPTAIVASYSGDANFKPSTSAVWNQVVNPEPATCTITVSPAGVTAFQTATITVSISPQFGGAAAGTVAVSDNGAPLGNAAVTANAASVTAQLAGGSHSLTASYSGSSQVTTAACSLTLNVGTSPTTLTLTSPGPINAGQAVIFTAKVTTTVPGTPSGTVTFTDGATALGTAALAAGVATLPASGLSAGTHTITATYGGDTNFGASSAQLTQVVTGPVALVTITSSPNPSILGDLVTFTVQVSATSGPVPTGTVQLYDNGSLLRTLPLSPSGQAVFRTPALPFGRNRIEAVYSGDAIYPRSVGDLPQDQIVIYPSSVTVTSSPDPSLFGEPVTFTVTVTSPPGSITPAGSVTLMDGANTIAMRDLNFGMVVLVDPQLTAGRHVITAVYSGDPNHDAATSRRLDQWVRPAATIIRAGYSPTPLPVTVVALNVTVLSGQSQEFVAMPTGTVQAFVGTTALSPPMSLDPYSSSATLFFQLPAGNSTVRVVYSGDTNFLADRESFAVDVGNPNPLASAITLTPQTITPKFVVCQIQVRSTTGSLVPTGTVQVWQGASAQTVTLTGGVATVTFPAILRGTNSVLSYSGDSIFLPAWAPLSVP